MACCLQTLSAQDRKFTVEQPLTLEPMAGAQYDDNVVDKRKRPGALIKISLPLEGVTFGNKQTLKEEFKDGVYWVYMPQGSKRLNINHKDYYPLEYTFDEPLSNPKAVYSMTIGIPQDKNSGKAYVTLTCPTTGAIVILKKDGSRHSFDDGQWQENLPYGEYEYTVQAPGFQDLTGKFVLQGPPVNVPIRLASVMGDLRVLRDQYGKLTIDGDTVSGVDSYTLPVGRHVVRCTEGTVVKERTVELTDAGTTVDMRLGGSLTLSNPRGATMTLNGNTYGRGQVVSGLLGRYSGYVSKPGYDGKSFNVNIGLNEDKDIDMHLLHEVDNVFFMEYLYQPKASISFNMSYCKRFGWGLTARFAPNCMKYMGNNEEDMSKVVTVAPMDPTLEYDNIFNDYRVGFTTGPMARLCHFLFVSVGVGYGKYANVYKRSEPLSYSEEIVDSYYAPRVLKGFECDAMLHVRIKKLIVSGGYNLLLSKGEMVGEFSIGVGVGINWD